MVARDTYASFITVLHICINFQCLASDGHFDIQHDKSLEKSTGGVFLVMLKHEDELRLINEDCDC